MEAIKCRMWYLPAGIYYAYHTLLIAVGRSQRSPDYKRWEDDQDFSELKKLDFLINPDFDRISHLVTPYVTMMCQERHFEGVSLAPLADEYAGGNYAGGSAGFSALDGVLRKFVEITPIPIQEFMNELQAEEFNAQWNDTKCVPARLVDFLLERATNEFKAAQKLENEARVRNSRGGREKVTSCRG